MKPLRVAKATQRTSKRRPTLTQEEVGLKYGFRSGLEERVANELTKAGISFTFEEHSFTYVKPPSKYTPDFVLSNGIIVETKGRFLTSDRQKHLLMKAQHPHLDIRFVFSNSNQRISKQSNTTYAKWCEKNGFRYADKSIPKEWLQ